MTRRCTRGVLIPLAVLAVLLVPATASAWQVVVHVHGAGQVSEVANKNGATRNQGSCNVSAGGKTESSVTNCVLGTTGGLWSHADIVRLAPDVPDAAHDRGWRYLKWVDGSATKSINGITHQQINCDPQPTTGDHTTPSYCEFQIFNNYYVDLYFEDVAGPNDVQINSAPSGSTQSTSATLQFNAPSDPDTVFECKLERAGGPAQGFTACGNALDKQQAYSSLADGQYTFSVRGIDGSSNVGNTATRSWTVDTTDPVPTITGGPTGTTSTTSGSFTVGTNEGTLTCTLDQVAQACAPGTRDFGPLSDGQHTFTVTATDAAGNVGTQTRTWTVDTTPPTVTFSAGPANGGFATEKNVTFAFSSSDGTRECSPDGGAFGSCGTEFSMPDLSEGEHTFAVRATDAVGNRATATRTFTVDTIAPDTTLLDGPEAGSTSPTNQATFSFASPESGSGFQCSLDDAPFTPCASPATLERLTNGDHTFRVRAVDKAGNVDATPSSRAWRVNDLDADADGINRPQDCNDANAAIRPGATDVADDGIDQDCDGADRVDLDRDRDGVSRPADCNDASAAIRPGAVDLPGNGTDEDCSGADAAVPPVSASISYRFAVRGSKTRVLVLRLTKLPRGATVTITCSRKRCPLRRRTARPNGTGSINVRNLLRGKSLPAGAKLTLRVAAPGTVSRVVTFTMRRRKAPTGGKLACLKPGSAKPVSC